MLLSLLTKANWLSNRVQDSWVAPERKGAEWCSRWLFSASRGQELRRKDGFRVMGDLVSRALVAAMEAPGDALENLSLKLPHSRPWEWSGTSFYRALLLFGVFLLHLLCKLVSGNVSSVCGPVYVGRDVALLFLLTLGHSVHLLLLVASCPWHSCTGSLYHVLYLYNLDCIIVGLLHGWLRVLNEIGACTSRSPVTNL